MAKCVGCGLEVTPAGFLQAKLKPGGGIGCDPNTGLFTDPAHNTDPSVIAVVTANNDCVKMSGGGTAVAPLTATLAIAPAQTDCGPNMIQCTPQGLYIAHPFSESGISTNGHIAGINGLTMVGPNHRYFFGPGAGVKVCTHCDGGNPNGTGVIGQSGTSHFYASFLVEVPPNSEVRSIAHTSQRYCDQPMNAPNPVFGTPVGGYPFTYTSITTFGFTANQRYQAMMSGDFTWQVQGVTPDGNTGCVCLDMFIVVDVFSGSAIGRSDGESEIAYHYSHTYAAAGPNSTGPGANAGKPGSYDNNQ